MDSGERVTAQQLADLRDRIEWWWDEAARCERIGALGLSAICRARAEILSEKLP